jgi:hypothetical protein
MHGLGPLLLLAGLFYLLFNLKDFLGKKKLFILPLVFLAMAISVYFLKESIFWRIKGFSTYNNFYYYRVFLTHNYLWLTLSAFLGFIWLGFKKKFKEWLIFLIILGLQTIVVSFFLIQPFTRYFYIVFPFLILLGSFFLHSLSELFRNKIRAHLFLILLVLLLVFFSRDKLSFVPQKTYSLNQDMQEIPEVDYKKIYGFIEKKLNDHPGTVFISNWYDHPIWYLGEGKLDYWLRVKASPSQTKDDFSGALLLDNLDSLKEIILKEKKGLIILESWENHLPQGTAEYIRLNLKKEFELDRLYSVQPRYWPVGVYSWGMAE